MKNYRLKRKIDNTVLYQGEFRSLRECLEAAVTAGKCLDGLNLKNANLANATLDGAIMRKADLTGANLSGANISEAVLSGSSLMHAALYNSCLCWSDLSACDLRHTHFGATDIAGAKLDASIFAGLSSFSLSFTDALSMRNCRYEDIDACLHEMSLPPLAVSGLDRAFAFLDETLLIGNKGCLAGSPDLAGDALPFFETYESLISEIISIRESNNNNRKLLTGEKYYSK